MTLMDDEMTKDKGDKAETEAKPEGKVLGAEMEPLRQPASAIPCLVSRPRCHRPKCKRRQ